MPVAPGDAFVAKDKETAFCEPMIRTNLVDNELIQEWLASSNTLKGWTEIFNLASKQVKEVIDEGKHTKKATQTHERSSP